ncbi:hypothetical protein BDY17DRAFT_296146 [Neohortaea acidophila]|uniref:Cation efflux protein transmembrane domain-containing protein n=1 Tax=Neohortaea acidophila TaxID=245834 RepID=A0A6A6PZ15_9PEZI|nr:uncharacterized protein BDY17DRAFT_296146 [Neohortaea acidophila]KAF2484693.1 hypothetical protein BDY17DRAFT_296146 [Neohortaea acidophila]
MTERRPSPEATRSGRVAQIRDFLNSSSDDSPISARGHAFPGLMGSRSTSNLAALRTRSWVNRRKNSIGEEHGAVHHPIRRTSDSDEDLPELQSRVLTSAVSHWGGGDREEIRRQSVPASLVAPQMRSQRLIGNTNPRYRWEQYWKTDEELKKMKKPIRKYYERTNYLIQHYLYIDRLLDSSLPHNLIQEYDYTTDGQAGRATSAALIGQNGVPATISEEPSVDGTETPTSAVEGNGGTGRLKRTPKDLYRIKDDETTPLLPNGGSVKASDEEQPLPPMLEPEEEAGSQSRIVSIAIYVNLVANTVLLILKIIVVIMSSSVSVLASLVDAALDFLSTAIVWTTTRLISRNDQYSYPIGRRRLEPIGVLVFSIIMICAFFQVAQEGVNKLRGDDHTPVRLTIAAIAIMAATVVIKGLCWLWCRLIKNSSVQALAQDAMTDVVFNIFSIIFPLVGFYANLWWLDPLGGILLSFYVMINWGRTSATHIKNLTGAAASADERNILLYLTMRFAKSIKKIQGLQAYHSGDKLNVEVDIVLDEHTNLRDSHDLGESLQYVLESVPNVDRAFVHMDYLDYNLPSHLQQDS